jgi:RimJ/RimL family protein N-acetyltransferase
MQTRNQTFDMQPNLEGDRVRLRPLARDDFGQLFAVASDPQLWAQHPASDRWQEPVFRRLFEDSIESGGAMVAIDKATRRIIGSSRYDAFDPAASRVEIGWSYLSRSHWGRDYNPDVKSLLLRHAFRFVDTVYFRVGETNARSRRAMEKIGGRLSERTETILLPDGAPVLHVVYEIARTDFLR